jgi:hypothetical protein
MPEEPTPDDAVDDTIVGGEVRTYTVVEGDARRVADALTIYLARNPRLWAPLAIVIVLLVLLLASGIGGGSRVAYVVILIAEVVFVPAAMLRRRTKVAAMMEVAAFRPGSRIVTEFGPSRFAVGEGAERSSRPYTEIAKGAVVRDIVLFRLVGSSGVVTLPRELVPDEPLDTLLGRR